MPDVVLKIFRGDREGGQTIDYQVPVAPGMVVLDALHHVQKHQAPDLAVRWNCKAGKCGSCSAEVNGRPRLTCKTRMDDLPQDQPITVLPMKSFPSNPVREWNGKSPSLMWTASKSFESVSNAFSARTCATYFANTTKRSS